jgi:hypothetical protein
MHYTVERRISGSGLIEAPIRHVRRTKTKKLSLAGRFPLLSLECVPPVEMTAVTTTTCFVAGLLNENKEVRLYKIPTSCQTQASSCRVTSISARDSKFQQDRRCTYTSNLILRCVRTTTVAVEKQ